MRQQEGGMIREKRVRRGERPRVRNCGSESGTEGRGEGGRR